MMVIIAVDSPHDIIILTYIPCTDSVEISDCALGLVDVHWTVMSSDTLEITSIDTVTPAIVIVILLFIGGSCSCVPLINHCIEPTGPTLETQVKVIEYL